MGLRKSIQELRDGIISSIIYINLPKENINFFYEYKNYNYIINMMAEEKVVDSTQVTVEKTSDAVEKAVIDEVAIEKVSDAVGDLAKDLADDAVNEVVSEVVGAGVGDAVGEAVGKIVETAVEGVSEEILEMAIVDVRHQLGAIGIKPTTLSIVIKHVMEVVENTPVKGKDQMNYAVLIISDLVNELEDGQEKTLLIEMLDNGSVRDTIELVVDASKGNIKINKVVEVAADGCLGPCFKYMTSIFFR